MKVAYVTTTDPIARLDDERDSALAAWRAAGIEGVPVVWHDPRVDWESFDAAVVRSTWDYPERRAEFLAWAHRVAAMTRLFNPAGVLEWNTDKAYLRELGVPTVPTYWAEPAGEFPTWDEYPEYVVKPAISGGARDTMRTADRAAAQRYAAELLAQGRAALVQPYLPTVEHEGELSLVYFGGRFSHAVRRHPMLSGVALSAANRATLRDPDDDQFALAERVLSRLPDEVLYARVDLVRMPDGQPVLMEFEVTEPYLFLRYEFAAPDMFADALAQALTGRR